MTSSFTALSRTSSLTRASAWAYGLARRADPDRHSLRAPELEAWLEDQLKIDEIEHMKDIQDGFDFQSSYQ
jgi:hypothetical protein